MTIGTTHIAARHQTVATREVGLFGTVRLIDPVPDAASAEVTRVRVVDAVAGLEPRRGQGLLVVGDDILASVLSAAGAELLDCVGEVAPGLPIFRRTGGRFDQVPLAAKSGGFGGSEPLVQLSS